MAGNKKDAQVFDFLINTLGTAFVSAANLFDLDNIIFYGEYSYQADVLANALQTYIQKHSVTAKVHPVLVIPSGQKDNMAPVAATVPALSHFF